MRIDDVTVVAATWLEARAVRAAIPEARLVVAGPGLSRLREPLAGAVVTCGVAGGLRPGLATGSVVVPAAVRRPDGGTLTCDPPLAAALAAAARALGLPVETGALVTSRELVTGGARRRWCDAGCVAADMETGLVLADRVATVRVVLDTPDRELAAAWTRPGRALRSPAAWRELPWLAREGPRCARLAAAVLAAALRGLDPHPNPPLREQKGRADAGRRNGLCPSE